MTTSLNDDEVVLWVLDRGQRGGMLSSSSTSATDTTYSTAGRAACLATADQLFGPLTDTKALHKAYRRLAVRVHPDKNAHCGAHAAFQVVQAAYEAARQADVTNANDPEGSVRSNASRARPPPPPSPPPPPHGPQGEHAWDSAAPPPPPPPVFFPSAHDGTTTRRPHATSAPPPPPPPPTSFMFTSSNPFYDNLGGKGHAHKPGSSPPAPTRPLPTLSSSSSSSSLNLSDGDVFGWREGGGTRVAPPFPPPHRSPALPTPRQPNVTQSGSPAMAASSVYRVAQPTMQRTGCTRQEPTTTAKNVLHDPLRCACGLSLKGRCFLCE